MIPQSIRIVVAGTLMLLAPLALGQTTQPATAQVSDDTVVIRVGSESITAGQFNDFISDLPPETQAMIQGPMKRMIATELVRIKLLAQEARREGLDKTERFQRQLDLVRDQVLAGMLAQHIQENIPDESLRQMFQESGTQFEQISARHILIRTPDSPVPAMPGAQPLTEEQAKAKADTIRQQLVDGADFGELAQKESADRGSAAEGGSLGFFGRGQMVPQFEEAAFNLKEGEISQPVKTQFGYHVIQLQQRQDSFEDARDDLAQRVAPQRLQERLSQLEANQKVEMNEDFFGPAQPLMDMMPMPQGE